MQKFCSFYSRAVDSITLLHNRLFFLQSMVAFLKDPSGPSLWEENPEAKDVVHIETEKVRSGLNTLLSSPVR